MASQVPIMTWQQLESMTDYSIDYVNGPTNPQSKLRLFGKSESDVRVTLFRDHHAWCPYCQKIWLWLEEKKIPYKVEKVTMFCYGAKEPWYKRKVPSGMLPAIELDGRIITESDDIIVALEKVYGPLQKGMRDSRVVPLRQLERLLFRAWCAWLCRPLRSKREEDAMRAKFQQIMSKVEEALGSTEGPYFLEKFGTTDVIFTPYVERMNASLYYYKGYNMRKENPKFGEWMDAMETRDTYRGTQSDLHTHVHDLPPQMGGCWESGAPEMLECKDRVNNGPWEGLPDVGFPEPKMSKEEALYRVCKHRDNVIKTNPADNTLFDTALRCALTNMMTGKVCTPPSGSDVALRYMRDHISVPRDMSVWAARVLRKSLESTAALAGDGQSKPLTKNHRRDQDPTRFAN
mmetsp:Transcript_611/g.740  ORF Transcript_611/g.740 Transcript_611/m.740 type:complete len:403 (+) Transcript_611:295-1503(+)